MGIGSCDNSVLVEDRLCVAVSGQRLCSEFAMQSVSDQQTCSELIDCPDPDGNDGSGGPISGESLQMYTVDRGGCGCEGEKAMAVENFSGIESVRGGCSLEENPNSGESIQMRNATEDWSTNEHEDEGTFVLENISKTNSIATAISLEENPNSDGFVQMCITTTYGSANENEYEVTLALENRSKTNSMPSVRSSEENPDSGGAIQMCNTTGGGSTNEHENDGTFVLENILKTDSIPSVSSSESSGESVQICTVAGNGSPCELEDESTLEHVSLINSMPSVSSLVGRNQSSVESMQMCTVTRDGFTCEHEDECTLAPPDKDDAGSLAAIGICLSENHDDFDAHLTDKTEKCSEDIEAQVSVAVENLTTKRESSLEVTAVVSLARGGCLSENRTEFGDCASGKVGEPSKNFGSAGEDVKLDATAIAGSSIQVHSIEYHSDQERSMGCAADGCCLNENHCDVAACTTEMSIPIVAESRVGKSDIGEVASVSGYASKGCSDEIHGCIGEISTERVGECLQERVEIHSELPREAIAMADLVSGGCLVEHLSEIDSCIVGRSENHIDSFSIQRDGDHLQVSSSKGEGVFEHNTEDCDFPLKVHVSNAEDIKEAADEKDEAFAADAYSKSCDQEPSLQKCEIPEFVPLDGVLCDTHGTKKQYSVCVSRPSMVDNCDLKSYPNKCIVLPSNGMKAEVVRAESNDDKFSEVSLATSQEYGHRSDTLSVCVPGYEHNEKVVDIPSANGVTEAVEKETCSISDATVQVGGPVVPLEANPCNDVSASQLSQPSYNTNDCSSERFSLVHSNGLLDHSKCTSPIGCFEPIDNQEKYTDVVNCVSEAKVCEIVSSSTQRSGRRSRSNRKTQSKKRSGKSRKTIKALSPKIGLEIAFKPTKKRSLCQSARSSAWGLVENVAQVFVSWNGVKDIIPVSNKRSRKSKAADKQNEKGKKKGSTDKAQGSKNRCPPLNTKLRLKVKIGIGANQSLENAMVSELVDTSALSTAICGRYGTELCANPPRDEDGRKGEASAHFMCLSSNEDNTCPVDTHGIADSSRDFVSEKLSADSSNKLCGVSTDVLVEVSESIENRSKDPGTSPDSEVINVIPDSHVDSRPHDDFGGVASSPKDPAAPGGLTSNERGEKKAKSPQSARKSRAKPSKQYGRKQKCNNGICYEGNLDSSAIEDVSSNLLSGKGPSMVEPSLLSKETVLRLSTGPLKGESGDCDLDTEAGLSKSETSKKPPSASKSHKCSDSRIEKVKTPPNKGENPQRSVGNKKTSKKTFDNQVACMVDNQPEAENNVEDNNGKTNTANGIWSTQEPCLDLLPRDVCEPHKLPRNAWVRCDSCHKWRRIAAELADLIEETQCSWNCKDNLDKSFDDCSIPQEKSNSDINAELDISDASGEEDGFGNRLSKGLECTQPREKQGTVTCTTIRTNQFLHRNRKTQTIDETMICHCKAPSDGQLGCGEDCLNRMLNIECAQGVCPCGDLCSNQQFQKRKYAKLDKFHCGKKGYGLKLQEDVPQGKFLIEYVGEVLDMQAYEARQKEYALKGHKHFYFMTLNGSEVIDACIKGNKGRFINHSCDPNCRTEKWMVNGEICIGLFALRDMKKGEEVTFDYNYVRVFGAAAKKCYCLSPNCRGYIGGDPLSGDVIIQSDSDEDLPKPRRRRDNLPGPRVNVICKAKSSGDVIKLTADLCVQNLDEGDKIPPEFGQSETSIEEDFVIHTVSPIHDPATLPLKEKVSPSVTPSEISQQTEDIANDDVSIVEKESSLEVETPVIEPEKSLSDDNYAGMMSKSDDIDERKLSSKVHSRVKTSRSPSTVKKERVKSSPQDASKVQLAANKSIVVPLQPKKGNESLLDSRFEAVEEKLNELLEPEGGISRRKDAAKGYLKLLLHTSMSNHESIQRNRDLSMILDALLKTRSRMVLVDIINKNGLRMLHNIMKQHRGDFKKIPILRKLLKVLEYLAYRDILTVEHIREDPPRPGMESFRESILSLTEHDDRQVHQIARNFRDRWIPKHLRRNCYLDRDDNKPEYISRSSRSNRYSPTRYNGSDHHSGNERSSESARSDRARMSSEPRDSSHSDRNAEANDRIKPPMPTPETPPVGTGAMDCASVGPRIRKRKSRWDQPADIFSVFSPLLLKELKVDPLLAVLEKSAAADDAQNEILEDFPPGFSPPVKPSPVPPAATSPIPPCSPATALGHPQEKFISRLPVSYGIPISIAQKFGTPLEEEASGRWAVAPGMPFHPFPPLPPFPREVKHTSPSGTAEEAAPEICHANSNDCSPSTTGDQPAVQTGSFSGKRGRESSYDLGTRYFKQQKLRPAWHWSRNAWGGCVGDSRAENNTNTAVSLGNVTDDLTPTLSCSDDSSNQHQDHQTQN